MKKLGKAFKDTMIYKSDDNKEKQKNQNTRVDELKEKHIIPNEILSESETLINNSTTDDE
jgi:hypothetical protein